MAVLAAEQGHQVVVLDNFRVSVPRFCPPHWWSATVAMRLFWTGCSRPSASTASCISPFIHVGESVQEPSKYYRNNVCHILKLLEAQHYPHP